MTRALTLTIHYGWYALCYAIFIGLVLLPFLTGMEPREFWRW